VYIRVKANTILLDESLLADGSEGRLRFSCAHEIGHWLRHKSFFAGTGRAAAMGDPRKSKAEFPAAERDANMMAAALLMPRAQVKKAFHRIRGVHDPAGELASLFGVSHKAMEIFMQEHNLA
jgi:Zn-dependent peptidase ImmA (M78 family)